MQKLKLLAQNGWTGIRCDPGDVPTRLREACDEFFSHRVGGEHHNWDVRRDDPDPSCPAARRSDDDVRGAADDGSGNVRTRIQKAAGLDPMPVHHQIPAFDVA